MVIDKSVASGKRFGARYGKRLRDKLARIEAEQRKKHKCPYCRTHAVKRVAAGIWGCKKCSSVFTGKAYTIPKKIVIKQELGKEEVVEVTEEEGTPEKVEEEKPQKYKETAPEEKEEHGEV